MNEAAVLDEKQEQNKFRNLLNAMSQRDQTIEKQGSRQTGRWVLSGSNLDKVSTSYRQGCRIFGLDKS